MSDYCRVIVNDGTEPVRDGWTHGEVVAMATAAAIRDGWDSFDVKFDGDVATVSAMKRVVLVPVNIKVSVKVGSDVKI